MYIGLSRFVEENSSGIGDLGTAYQFRIKSPTGNVVHGPHAVSSPNLTSYTMANTGPAAIYAGGYPTNNAMWVFDPSGKGLSSGDYYIEFNTAGAIRWFDITVASAGANSTAKEGRLWSQAWAVRATDGFGDRQYFDEPFNGVLIAYDGKYATKIDFDGSGIRPLEGQFTFNSTGTGNTGNKVNDRRSINDRPSGNPVHKIFLNRPDSAVYPLEVEGTLQNLPLKVADPANPAITVEVTQAGKIEVLLNLGGGNKDRRLFADVTAGSNQIPWDGKTGEGVKTLPSDYPINVNISYTQGETHFTAYDVEGLDNGFQVFTQTSNSVIGPRLQFWDDTNIPDSPGSSDVKVNVDTGATTRRRWTNKSYGDLNTINTWWYAYRDAQTTTVLLPADYGDAPTSYGSAAHKVLETPTTYLGAIAPDKESQAATPLDGTGDNANATDDEDALSSLPTLQTTSTDYSVTIPCVGNGTLAAWIDFDQSGVFEDSERQFAVCDASGAVALAWSSLSGLSAGITYIRLRIASDAAQVAKAVGGASDGEVEDYTLNIETPEYDYGDAPDDGGDFKYGIAKHLLPPNPDLFMGAKKPSKDDDNNYDNWKKEWKTDGKYKDWFNNNKERRKKGNGHKKKDEVVDPAPDVVGDGDEEDGLVSTVFNWSNGTSCTGLLPDGSNGSIAMTDTRYCITVKASNNSAIAAQLVGWIDFNQNGEFDDPSERSVVNVDADISNDSTQGNVPAGTNDQAIVLYWDNQTKIAGEFNTFIRLRLTSDPEFKSNNSPDPIGVAINGEVEDTNIGINITGTDFGDAPASYGDASHIIELNAYMGTILDNDNATQNTANASTDGRGDDNDGFDDDDGISSLPSLKTHFSSYSIDVTVTSPTATAANLVGWIDFDNNGVFDSDEAAIVTVPQNTTESIVTLQWSTIPADIQAGSSYLRLRLTTDTSIATGVANTSVATGLANDGEVEDYTLTILQGKIYQCPTAIADIWFANDESGSVSDTEFKDALDFLYQVSDEFVFDDVTGIKAGITGWGSNVASAEVIMPITETFGDPDDSGLISTSIVTDGDSAGLRELYDTKKNTSTGTRLDYATTYLTNLINAGNGRRAGVPQLAFILTDAFDYQITGTGGGAGWIAAADNLRNAGADGTKVIIMLTEAAAIAYANDANVKNVVDAAAGSNGKVFVSATYAEIVDPVNGYIAAVTAEICNALLKSDFGDAPATYGDAIHTQPTVSSVYLGAAAPDDENATQLGGDAGVGADGDDSDGNDDDDGISTFPLLNDLTTSYTLPAANITATGVGATLHAWIDFDANGVFDADEYANTSVGTNLVWNTVPTDIKFGETYARFRLTTDASINATTPATEASDGEVEDYALTIEVGGYEVNGRVYNDSNVDGVNDTAEVGIGGLPVVLVKIEANTANNICVSTKTRADGSYAFFPVIPGQYQLYEASRETVSIPQNCDISKAKDPVGYRSTTNNVLTVFNVVDAEITGKDFGDVNEPHFTPSNTGSVLPNNSVFYSHTFTPKSTGTVSFTTASNTPTTSGWTSVIYQDANCNGTLEGAEGSAPISSNLVATANSKICLINKVYSPSNVVMEEIYSNVISADFSFNGNALAGNVTLNVTDLTKAAANDSVLGSSRLELRKTVQNITQGGVETDTQNQAKSGDVLQYRLYYSNSGTGAITDLMINDTVPAFTTLTGAPVCEMPLPESLSSCTPSVNTDEIIWTFPANDVLRGGAKGMVSYKVIVD